MLTRILAFILALGITPAWADGTINTLGAGTTLGGTESLPMYQTANPAVKTTPADIRTYTVNNSGITGSTQCIHANSSGVLSGTGSDCGSGGSGIPVQVYKAGNYYPPYSYVAATGTTVAGNQARCVPWIPAATATVDTISIRVTTAGSNSQFAIYASGASTRWPTSTPLATTGQFVSNANAVATGSFTAGTGNSGSNIQVTAGTLYFICANFDNAAQVNVVSSSTFEGIMYVLGSVATSQLGSTLPPQSLAYTGQTFGTWNDLTAITPAESTNQGWAFPFVHLVSVP